MPTKPKSPKAPEPARVLTLATLKKRGACSDQAALFRKMFGASVEITEALCVKHAGDFSWGWAANNLLSTTARKAYRDAIATARKAYGDAIATASKAYGDATAPASKAYGDATAPARKAYDDATATASKAYGDATAPAWARAYITDAEPVS